MPNRNSRKDYVSQSYYHVYNRGVEKRQIFYDEQDYTVFLSYLKRYLSIANEKDGSDRSYPKYASVELLAYCLMPNHFHLLVYVDEEPRQLAKLLQSACVAYTMYFNKRYERVGHLFQGRFKAVRITGDGQLQHISRYIHLNPKQYKSWKWSSLPNYLGNRVDDWIHPARILRIFSEVAYNSFVDDYVEQKSIIDDIKTELANS